MSTVIGTVASVHRFPVKSMLGDAPPSVEVDEGGVVGDRSWALRDVETDKIVSAKRPRLWQAMLECQASGTNDDVTVALPNAEQTYAIDDPALPTALEALFGREVRVERWTAPMQGSYTSDWPEIDGLTLTGEMDIPTNLLGLGAGFLDVGVLHLLTTTAMASLAAADPSLQLDVRRFRPSILLDTPGLVGFPENEWEGRRLRIGDVVISAEGPAPRCIMTTLGQGGLPRQPGVLQATARENRQTNEMGTFACLGSYASVAEGGIVSVGDEVVLD